MLLFLLVVGSFWRADYRLRSEPGQAGPSEVGIHDEARGSGGSARRFVDTVMSGGYIADSGSADAFWMARALERARQAGAAGEVPVGALVVRDGAILGAGGNATERSQDPTAHAEMIAIRQAAEAIGSRRFQETALYVTLEPCAMCAGAIVLARIPRILFGACRSQGGRLRNAAQRGAGSPAQPYVPGRRRGARERVRRPAAGVLLRPEVGTFSRAERCPSGRRGRSRKPLWPSRSPWVRIPPSPPSGEMTEWSKVHDWKSCVAFVASPRVRIPLSPPVQESRWGSSSVGRALESHSRGRGFDSHLLHHNPRGVRAGRGPGAAPD